MTHILENFRFVNALAPVADAFAGTVYPTGFNMKDAGRIAWLVVKGVGTTGTSTVTVLAGDTTSPQTETAVEFTYRRIAANNTTIGAVTAATTAGFVTTAGTGDMYIVEIDSRKLAASGYAYAHLKLVESVDSPVLGTVIAIATDLRFADATSDVVS
jgi:hypothetical protein